MMMATDKKFMGQFAIGFRLKVAGVICTGVMAQVVIAMFATYFFETALRIVSPQLIPVLHRLAIGLVRTIKSAVSRSVPVCTKDADSGDSIKSIINIILKYII